MDDYFPSNFARILIALGTFFLCLEDQDLVAQQRGLSNADDGQQILEQAISSWSAMQHRDASMSFHLAAKTTYAKRSHWNIVLEKHFPPDDYTHELEVYGVVDFDRHRFRRETKSEIYHLNKQTFEPDVRYDLFDGETLQRFYPAAFDSDGKATGAKRLTAKLILRNSAQPGDLIGSLESPLFWCRGMLPTCTIGPNRFSAKLEAEMFVYEGQQQTELGTTHVIRFEFPEHPNRCWKYWLSKDDGWLPVRRSKYVGDVEYSRIVVHYATSQDGSPEPHRWTLTTYSAESEVNKVMQTTRCALRKLETDVDLAAIRFQIERTPAMQVQDQREP